MLFSRTSLVGYKLEQRHMFGKLASLHDVQPGLTLVGQTMATSVSKCLTKVLQKNLNLHSRSVWNHCFSIFLNLLWLRLGEFSAPRGSFPPQLARYKVGVL